MRSNIQKAPAWEPLPFAASPPVTPAQSRPDDIGLARAMADHLIAQRPGSPSDALKMLRLAFPHMPLTARVAALDALMRRSR